MTDPHDYRAMSSDTLNRLAANLDEIIRDAQQCLTWAFFGRSAAEQLRAVRYELARRQARAERSEVACHV